MILGSLRRVLTQEGEAVLALAGRLDAAFVTATEAILESQGRVVCCGLGKSGHVAAKAAATFASTGRPALFLHAAEALHGDLGMVASGDVALLYSYSGETDELVRLMPGLAAQGARTVLVTGRPDSSAGRLAEIVLNVSVDSEACPNGLAPTTSTTVMLAVSDALAVAVMEARGFKAEDFARLHPAGSLGRRLTLRVRDVMRTGDELPVVGPRDSISDLLRVITQAGAGGACVVDGDGSLLGFVSDGDLRRWFLRADDPKTGSAGDLMTPTPATVTAELLAVEGLEVMQNFPAKIGELPVVEGRRLVGLLVLKDLLRAGIV
jgi:arabinose-5-phosphate isomerase